MKFSDIEEDSTQRICIFGAPKTGKSQLAGTLAEHGYNLKWFDLENGSSVLRKLSKEAKDRIDLFSLPDTRTYPIAVETMLKVLKGGPNNICDKHGKVGCVLCKKEGGSFSTIDVNTLGPMDILVIDSLTQLANSVMANITRAMDDEYKYDWDDYRKQGTLMDKALSHIQQAKYNVICISHETETEMDDGKKKIVPVAGTTNFSRNTAKYFDHIVHTEVNNKKHKFGSGTGFSLTALTGSRTDVEIEKQTEGEASLLPFFNGTIPKQAATQSAESGTTSISRLQALRAKAAGSKTE